MSLDSDVTAARTAARSLEQACVVVTKHFGETVDVRRLRNDVRRVWDDLELLCGGERSAAAAAPLEVIDDTAYDPAFWADAEDEGLGASGRKPR